MSRIGNMLGALALAVADRLRTAERQALPASAPAAAIVHLSHCSRPSIESLSDVLALSHSAAVRLADRLERDGLAERAAAGWDNRAVALRLTRSGSEQASSYLAARSAVLETLLHDGIPDADLKAFERVVDHLLGKLTTDRRQLYRNCRLCDFSTCNDCPVERAVA